MSQIALSGASTGSASFEIQAPATNTNRTITLPDASGQVSVLDLRAAQTASGTAVDFLNIPATARRITVMFNGVSTNGTSGYLVQAGTSGGVVSSGYASGGSSGSGSVASSASSAGFLTVRAAAATQAWTGSAVITNITSTSWHCTASLNETTGGAFASAGGSVTLSGPLTQLRITTVNGTDTFDAGTINILVE